MKVHSFTVAHFYIKCQLSEVDLKGRVNLNRPASSPQSCNSGVYNVMMVSARKGEGERSCHAVEILLTVVALLFVDDGTK